jgi:hypothetical protein
MGSWVERIDTLPERVYHRFFREHNAARQTIASIFSFAVVGGSLALVVFVLRKTKLNRVLLTATGIIEKDALLDEPVVQRNHNRAKYLMRESARLVASAIEKSGSNLLEAYENAAQAAVLARTAKDIDENISKLSEELGVDFHDYLSYTTTVVQGLRTKLRHG